MIYQTMWVGGKKYHIVSYDSLEGSLVHMLRLMIRTVPQSNDDRKIFFLSNDDRNVRCGQGV